jgi:hypothetical protein
LSCAIAEAFPSTAGGLAAAIAPRNKAEDSKYKIFYQKAGTKGKQFPDIVGSLDLIRGCLCFAGPGASFSQNMKQGR